MKRMTMGQKLPSESSVGEDGRCVPHVNQVVVA